MNVLRNAFAFASSLVLWGCGGSAPGFTTGGTVQLDAKPLPWGQVYLRSQVDAQSHETSQGFFEVRDGQFDSGAVRLLPGPHAVTIFVHAGAAPPLPDAAATEASGPEPKVIGQWEGEASVAPDQPLTFNLSQADLKPVPK